MSLLGNIEITKRISQQETHEKKLTLYNGLGSRYLPFAGEDIFAKFAGFQAHFTIPNDFGFEKVGEEKGRVDGRRQPLDG